MFTIEEFRPAQAPSQLSDSDWSTRRFFSASGDMVAEFYNPFEFHMGATSWDIRIQTAEGEMLDTAWLPTGKLRLSSSYQPWVGMGNVILLADWSNNYIVCDLLKRDQKKIESPNWPHEAIASRGFDRFVVEKEGRLLFFDSEASLLAEQHFPQNLDEQFHFEWVGPYLCAFGRKPSETDQKLLVYDGRDGSFLMEEEVNPIQHVPYDEDAYRHIKRDHFSLQVSGGHWCVGYFLDVWSKIILEEEKSRFLLKTYRPSGPEHNEQGRVVIPVEAVWMSLTYGLNDA